MTWRIAGIIAAVLAIFFAGWISNGWRKDAEISSIVEKQAKADLTSAKKALADLNAASKTIHDKADEFNAVNVTLGQKLDAIRKDLKNAKPLPVDCKPDDFRLRKLSDSISAANKAATGQ